MVRTAKILLPILLIVCTAVPPEFLSRSVTSVDKLSSWLSKLCERINWPTGLFWSWASRISCGTELIKLWVWRTSGGAMLAINTANRPTTITNEIDVATERLPFIGPGKCWAIKWTGWFSASVRKKAVNTRINALAAALTAKINTIAARTRPISLITVRVLTVTSTVCVRSASLLKSLNIAVLSHGTNCQASHFSGW